MSKTFAQLKTEVRQAAFPAGEAPNLVLHHNRAIVEALVDLQTWVECYQIGNTHLIPHCATAYKCGLTVADAPRGRILGVSVVGAVDETSKGTKNLAVSLTEAFAENLPFGVSDVGKSNSSVVRIRCAPGSDVRGLFTAGGSGTAFTATCQLTVEPVEGTPGESADYTLTLNTTPGAEPTLLFTADADGGTYDVTIVQQIVSMSGTVGQRIQEGRYLATMLDYLAAQLRDVASSADTDWCAEVPYQRLDICHVNRYFQSFTGDGCGCDFGLYFGLNDVKPRPPVSVNSGNGLPPLPLGHHYAHRSTDAGRRATSGMWALDRGKLYVLPWIESNETLMVRWDGIKRAWVDGDLVDDDPKLFRAVEMYLRMDHAQKYDHDNEAAERWRNEYNLTMSELIAECRQETMERPCAASNARGALSSPTDRELTLYFNDEVSATAICPEGQEGEPVVVTIPAETVGGSSKQDANAKALALATEQANAALRCTRVVPTVGNDEVSFTARCEKQGSDAPDPTGQAVTVVIPSNTLQRSTKDAANAAALERATAQAYSALVCTFYNREAEHTATCPFNSNTHTTTIPPQTDPYKAEAKPATLANQAAAQTLADKLATDAAKKDAEENVDCQIYYNSQRSASATLRCLCGAVEGNMQRWENITAHVIIPANTYSSIESQQQANQQADAQAAQSAFFAVQNMCQQQRCGTFSFLYPDLNNPIS